MTGEPSTAKHNEVAQAAQGADLTPSNGGDGQGTSLPVAQASQEPRIEVVDHGSKPPAGQPPQEPGADGTNGGDGNGASYKLHPQRMYGIDDIIGISAAIKKIRREVKRVAPYDISVLILGESGVGKELVAQALHRENPNRYKKHFIPINCAALDNGVVDSELFGHKKGSFSGAIADHSGVFLASDGGTLFLDEVAELPQGTQAKLLRVLESGEVMRVGSNKREPYNARIISATNKNLEDALGDGSFREELFYRLKGYVIYIPPLRDRPADIMPIALHILRYANERFKQSNIEGYGKDRTFVPDLENTLKAHHWPGNIRELKHIIGSACIIAKDEDGVITTEIINEAIGQVSRYGERVQAIVLPTGNGTSLSIPLLGPNGRLLTLDELETGYIEMVYGACSGNKTEAAWHMGISLRSLYRRLDTHGIREPPSVGTHSDLASLIGGVANASLSDVEKEAILRALADAKGNKREAAKTLGVSPKTLYNKVSAYGKADQRFQPYISRR